jgi:hypothetical protein
MCVKYQSDLIILLVYIVKYHELTLKSLFVGGIVAFNIFQL